MKHLGTFSGALLKCVCSKPTKNEENWFIEITVCLNIVHFHGKPVSIQIAILESVVGYH